MDKMTLKATPRTSLGTRATKALREDGLLPVIIYGHGEAPEPVSLAQHDVEVALAHGARMLTVEQEGATQQYLIKDVQYDHFGATPIHLDLARVSLDETVKVRVGIELRGVAKGVSEGGVMDQHIADLEVECLVTQIPETLHPFVTELGVGDSLFIKDLELPEGVTAVADPEDRVATVRALVEEVEEEEAEPSEEGEAEPERIGRVRKEEGEGEESKG